MAKQAREAIGAEALSVVADRGYFKGDEILACHDAKITAYVPKPGSKRTVEHPFGTLKQWMGATHFLTRKLNGVNAEMSLNVLAYN